MEKFKLSPASRLKMVNAVTAFDIKQSKKKGYNRYALALYFQAIDNITEDMANGVELRKAIERNFIGRLLDAVLKTLD